MVATIGHEVWKCAGREVQTRRPRGHKRGE